MIGFDPVEIGKDIVVYKKRFLIKSELLSKPWNKISYIITISWFDLIYLLILFIGGFSYLYHYEYWSNALVGEVQYGDAEFWWRGAMNVAHGIFQDNPGKTFRPGYFLMTGLTLPVLGQQFEQYYPYFLMVFLATAGFFYLALRSLLGRWVMACAVAMLVFNPFTAGWLATSTTDGTGLLVNMAALASLVVGLNQGLSKKWLALFGLLFSLSTLTRPLVTPFIFFVMLMLFIMSSESLKKRCWAVAVIAMAFFFPTCLWMLIQKLSIGEWTISSNDASAFYAASDPNIQLWNPAMYGYIKQLAAQYFQVSPTQLTSQQINHLFWIETFKNYIAHFDYHLQRVMPHLLEIASFSPKIATHGTAFWQKMLLATVALGISVKFLYYRHYWRASVLIAIALSLAFSFAAKLMPFMTLSGALLALCQLGRNTKQISIFLLSAYWFIGVFALYLVGGTFGTPSFSSSFMLSALGYRLGSQIFFVGDLLACYFILRIAYFNTQNEWMTATQTNFLLSRPVPLASGVILSCYGVLLVATGIVYTMGSYSVLQRAYAFSHGIIQPYPSIDELMNVYQKTTGRQIGDFVQSNRNSSKVHQSDLIFTGAVSPFIWNFPGQNRARCMVHVQKQIYPFTMGSNIKMVDVPQHINFKEWDGVQGAFVVHEVPNTHNISNLPYYLTGPQVTAFFPLTSDGKKFDLSKVKWFPIVKNATQLDTRGELQSQNGKIRWSEDSGDQSFQRRFFLAPESNFLGKAKLRLLILDKQHENKLSFAYKLGLPPGKFAKKGSDNTATFKTNYELVVSAKKGRDTMVLTKTMSNSRALQNVELSILPGIDSVEVEFSNVPAHAGIWLYEFNLILMS